MMNLISAFKTQIDLSWQQPIKDVTTSTYIFDGTITKPINELLLQEIKIKNYIFLYEQSA